LYVEFYALRDEVVSAVNERGRCSGLIEPERMGGMMGGAQSGITFAVPSFRNRHRSSTPPEV
jgi:hypothetical protein